MDGSHEHSSSGMMVEHGPGLSKTGQQCYAGIGGSPKRRHCSDRGIVTRERNRVVRVRVLFVSACIRRSGDIHLSCGWQGGGAIYVTF